MADIVNLRRARKAKARDDAAKQADANRLLFGRGKAEKGKAKAVSSLAAARLDAHRREPGDKS